MSEVEAFAEAVTEANRPEKTGARADHTLRRSRKGLLAMWVDGIRGGAKS